MSEREAIVKWLTEQAKECQKDGYPEDARVLRYAAKEIKRGEHQHKDKTDDK